MTKRKSKPTKKKYRARRLSWMVASAFFVICCGLPSLAVLLVKPTPTVAPAAQAALIAATPQRTTVSAVTATQKAGPLTIPTSTRRAALITNTLVLTDEPPTVTPAPIYVVVTSTPTPRYVVVTSTPIVLPSSDNGIAATVLINGLNVRSGPGTGYNVVTQAKQGDVLTVTARTPNSDYLRVKLGGYTGWIIVQADLVQIVGKLGNLPVENVAVRLAVTANAITGGGAPALRSTLPPVESGGICPNINATCTQLSSCTEARACLAAGNRSLDRDHDGIPCETMCGG